MIIVFSLTPLATSTDWYLWHDGSPHPHIDGIRRWWVYRTWDHDTPTPDGGTQIIEGEEIPASEAEIAAVQRYWNRVTRRVPDAGPLTEDRILRIIQHARCDPGRDPLAWRAPLLMTAHEAGIIYCTALPDLDTRETQIVLRESPSGWLAWIGVGTHMVAVHGGTRRKERRMQQRHPDQIIPTGDGCLFASPDDAMAAARVLIRQYRIGLRDRVMAAFAGWRTDILQANYLWTMRPWLTGSDIMAGIQVRTGTAGDETSSWDLATTARS